MEPGLEPPPAVADAVEHEHPPAAQAERLAGPGVPVDGVHHPQAEGEERDADDTPHQGIKPVGEQGSEAERREPKDDHPTP
jgi:hypothetical protein